MITKTRGRIARALVVALSVGATLGLSAGTAQAGPTTTSPAKFSPAKIVGHVYQATNEADHNAVAVFDRLSDGTLRPRGTAPTGGAGGGGSLASQGGLVRDGSLLFVVNAGDNTISVLDTKGLNAKGGSLRLRDRIGSGGDRPVSLTVRRGVGYVLNHDSDTIVGFRYTSAGHLRSLPGSTRRLTRNPAGGLTDAAQIQFSPNGRRLVVTEKASNSIDTFKVRSGRAGVARPHPSAGMVPYGFDFDRRGTLVVSEAATGSASSYRVAPRFRAVTKALGNTQAAACWVAISGHYAWVVNAASDSISSYRIGHDGSLTLVKAVAASTGMGPTEAAVAPGGQSLQVRLGDGSVQSFRIGAHGTLSSLGTARVTTNYGIAGLAAD